MNPLERVAYDVGQAARVAWFYANAELAGRFAPPIVEPAEIEGALPTYRQMMGDLYELFVFAKRNGIDYNQDYIPGDFPDTSTQAFDPVYMGKLFNLGYQMAEAGYPWKKTPPRMVGH